VIDSTGTRKGKPSCLLLVLLLLLHTRRRLLLLLVGRRPVTGIGCSSIRFEVVEVKDFGEIDDGPLGHVVTLSGVRFHTVPHLLGDRRFRKILSGERVSRNLVERCRDFAHRHRISQGANSVVDDSGSLGGEPAKHFRVQLGERTSLVSGHSLRNVNLFQFLFEREGFLLLLVPILLLLLIASGSSFESSEFCRGLVVTRLKALRRLGNSVQSRQLSASGDNCISFRLGQQLKVNILEGVDRRLLLLLILLLVVSSVGAGCVTARLLMVVSTSASSDATSTVVAFEEKETLPFCNGCKSVPILPPNGLILLMFSVGFLFLVLVAVSLRFSSEKDSLHLSHHTNLCLELCQLLSGLCVLNLIKLSLTETIEESLELRIGNAAKTFPKVFRHEDAGDKVAVRCHIVC
jgi:hypothetical protein